MIDKIVEMLAAYLDPEQTSRIQTVHLVIEKREVRPV
jgi:hypothetical protein